MASLSRPFDRSDSAALLPAGDSSTPHLAYRVDVSKFSPQVADAPGGGIRAPARLTRTGVFTYTSADGSKYRELRHPDEVFHPDSLSSLRGAPLTLGHPEGGVNPSSYQRLAIGHVGDDVARESPRGPAPAVEFVKSTTYVGDGGAIGGLRARSLGELSCGYSCTVTHAPGTYNGEAYDGVQSNIRYNHVALGYAKDWGRAGGSVRVQVDGAKGPPGGPLNGPDKWRYDAAHSEVGDACESDSPADPLVEPPSVLPAPRADGSDWNHMDPKELEKLLKEAREQRDAEKARADKAEATAATERARADKAEGAAAVEKARADKAESELTPAALEPRIQARVNLVDSARKVLGGEYKADGKADRAVMIDVLAKTSPALRLDDKSADAFIQGAFVASVASAPTASLGAAQAAGASTSVTDSAGASRTDADPDILPYQANATAAFFKRDQERLKALRGGI